MNTTYRRPSCKNNYTIFCFDQPVSLWCRNAIPLRDLPLAFRFPPRRVATIPCGGRAWAVRTRPKALPTPTTTTRDGRYAVREIPKRPRIFALVYGPRPSCFSEYTTKACPLFSRENMLAVFIRPLCCAPLGSCLSVLRHLQRWLLLFRNAVLLPLLRSILYWLRQTSLAQCKKCNDT